MKDHACQDESLNFILNAVRSHLKNIPYNYDLKSLRSNWWNFLDASNSLPLGPRLWCLAWNSCRLWLYSLPWEQGLTPLAQTMGSFPWYWAIGWSLSGWGLPEMSCRPMMSEGWDMGNGWGVTAAITVPPLHSWKIKNHPPGPLIKESLHFWRNSTFCKTQFLLETYSCEKTSSFRVKLIWIWVLALLQAVRTYTS